MRAGPPSGFCPPRRSVLPDRADLRELCRPWKLAGFAIGMAWLLYGALFHGIGDWDVGVSLVMGTGTYLTAPWAVHVIARACRDRPPHAWLHVLVALGVAVLVVDTSYLAWHAAMGNPTFRAENFRASIALYFLAGMLWQYRGSVADFFRQLRASRRRARR
jgi:hypothetical protein